MRAPIQARAPQVVKHALELDALTEESRQALDVEEVTCQRADKERLLAGAQQAQKGRTHSGQFNECTKKQQMSANETV